MINRVFADDEFESRSKLTSRRWRPKSASAVSLAKNLLYHMDGMTFETGDRSGRPDSNAITRMTEDCKRGVERFLKKQG